MRKSVFIILIIQILSLWINEPKLFGQSKEIEEAFSATFTQPLAAEYSHTGSEYLYVVEKAGEIHRLNINEPSAAPDLWLDIKSRVTTPGESGLLGLAFHPDYPGNNTFYVYYSHSDGGQLKSRISRFYVTNDVADADSEEILLEFDQPDSRHNGGTTKFGPDGYLYIASGDGAFEITDDAQNTLNYFGTILRMDVSTETGYSVPADNPFAGSEEGLDEIYAWGFRNPWKMSFDSETGNLWVADVGEKDMESIYVVENGKNYGWPIVEGSECFDGSDCDKTGLEMPIYEYPWSDETGKSVTGGYVYRGTDNPSLQGKYIYGDFITGRIWSLEVDHENLVALSNEELIDTDLLIPSFGVDSNNELYILSYGSDAKIYRFVPEEVVNPPPAITLSAPGDGASGVALDSLLSWQAGDGAESYRVQVSELSDFSSVVDDRSGVEATQSAVSGLGYESLYYWRVSGVNAAGQGEWSEVWSFTTEAEPLSEPGVVSLSSPGDGSEGESVTPELGWLGEDVAESYDVQVSESGDVSSPVVDLSGVEGPSVALADPLGYETVYYWRVRGVNQAGPGQWSEVWSFTTEPEPLSVPGAIVLSAPGDGASGVALDSLLSWQAGDGSESYRVQVSELSDFSSFVDDRSGVEGTQSAVSGLVYESQYYWRVAGVNQAGQGEWSAVWGFTTKAPPSADGLVLNELEDAIELQWQLSAEGDISQYNIYRGPAVSDLEIIASVSGSVLEYVDSNLPEGASLYAVTAVDMNNQESDFSNIVSYYNTSAMVTQDWKMVSIPIHHEGIKLQNSEVFSFSRVYQSDNTMMPLKGYWVKSPDGENYSIKGEGMEKASLALNSGWNLIGGLIDEVPVESIQDPSGILTTAPVYVYNGSNYQEVSSLLPSEGYWIYANDEGIIQLDINNNINALQSSDPLAVAAMRHLELKPDRIIFSRNNTELSFWVTDTNLGQIELYRYLLPPQSPNPTLDIRSGPGYNISDSRSTSLKLTSAGYPVTVSAELDEEEDYMYRIIAMDNDGVIEHINLLPGQKQVINKEYASLTLERIHKDDAILETAIDPGYPNPFNPVTNIRYQLVKQEDVQIDVYDTVGRRVVTLVNEVKQPGVYTIRFDGTNMASGLYFLRLQAGGFVDVQKLTLIK